jgi:hypothetical protein
VGADVILVQKCFTAAFHHSFSLCPSFIQLAFKDAFASNFSCIFYDHTSYKHTRYNMRVVVSKFTSCVVKRRLGLWCGWCVLRFWKMRGLNAIAEKRMHWRNVALRQESILIAFVAPELRFSESSMHCNYVGCKCDDRRLSTGTAHWIKASK